MFIKILLILNFIFFGSAVPCKISFPVDQSKRPTVFKKIGSRQVNILHKPSIIQLQEGEQITAHCNTSFVNPSSYLGQTEINITCYNGQVQGVYSYDRYNPILLECDSLTWNMYEASTPFSWCSPPMVSYILAQRSSGYNNFNILAGICYSFDDMSVQSMHYVMSPKSTKYLNQSRFYEYIPRTKIPYIADNFISRPLSEPASQNDQLLHWLSFANYEIHFLIESSAIYGDTNLQLGGLLDIAWWSGLRLGNWHFYKEALRQHIESENIEYDILAGISGTVSVPIYKDSCHEHRNWVEVIDAKNHTIPLYIWNYLKSSEDENSEEVVIIGVNSPFYEFYAERDLIFCRDICSQINWLQRALATFRYKSMGVIFCCSVEDVTASKRLNGFEMLPQPIAAKPEPLRVWISDPTTEENDITTDYTNEYEED